MSQSLPASRGLIRRLRLKIGFLLALRHALFFLTIFGLLLGTVILIARVTFAVPRQTLLWTLACLLPGVAWAIVRAVGETPSEKALCALFDEKNKCGGLLMAAEEVDLGEWRQRIPPISTPRLRWRGGRSLAFFASAALFVVVSFIVPQRYMSMTTATPLNVSEDIEKLGEQIDTLEEEAIISEEVGQELDQELQQLRDTASAYDPVKTWEALDHLQQTMGKEAEQFAASSLSQTEELSQIETLARGLSDDAGNLDPGLLSEAMSELSRMVQSHASKNELLRKNLGAECLNACKQGKLSAENLAELLKALKETKGAISDRLAKLCKAQLVDIETLKLCEKKGACNSKGLVAFLNKNARKMGTCDAVSLYCQIPGQGGVDRGRGDAPMTWSDGSSEESTAFKEQVLPPASFAALKDSTVIGVTAAAPTVEGTPATSGTGALDSATAGSGEAFSQTVLPRHKGAVKRYFERE